MRQAALLVLAVFVCIQRGIGFLPVKAGPADLLLGLIIMALGVDLIRSRGKNRPALPPWYISLLLLTVMISSLISAFADPSKAIIKEGLQTIEVLVFGWMAAVALFKTASGPRLFQRTIIITCGIEALIVLVNIFTAANRFYPGLISVNRNTFTLLLILCAPMALIMAAEEDSRLWRGISMAFLFLAGVTVIAGGALVAGIIGLGAGLCFTPQKKRALLGLIPFVLGLTILLAIPDTLNLTHKAVCPNARENHLIRERTTEYDAEKEAYFEAHPQWFKSSTAMRYRRWAFARRHAAHSARNLMAGAGPGAFNSALKPFGAAESRPNINTDVYMMYNIGVNEPDTYSAYSVQLVETGLIGLIGLAVFLITPLIIFWRKRTTAAAPQRGAAASLAGLLILNIFFSHMITGTYLLVVMLIYMAVNNPQSEVPTTADD